MSQLEELRSGFLYKQLSLLVPSNEGNLLEDTDPQTAEAQLSFLRYALDLAKPTRILETGTCKNYFGYFLSRHLKRATLFTCDHNHLSRAGADLLNRSQNALKVHFVYGDTKETLTRFYEPNIGFAWIDGGFDDNTVWNDISHAMRLRIPYIAVDDYKFFSHFPRIVQRTLIENSDYYIEGNPYFQQDTRGAILLALSR